VDLESNYQWLASSITDEAWACCQQANSFPKSLLAKLGLSPFQSQWFHTQMEFAVGPAQRKVAQPWNWFWTKILLEQASDQWVAQETAQDFPKGIQVVDGCCGAGVDSIALAQHLHLSSGSLDSVLPIDASELACELTRWNSRRNGSSLSPRQARFEDADLPTDAWIHLDPDRRATGRTVDVYSTEPSWTSIADRIGRAPGASVKAAPGFQPDAEFPWGECGAPNARRWISRDGTVRQQRLYWRIPRWEKASRIASGFRKASGWHHEVFDEELLGDSERYYRIVHDRSEIQPGSYVADHDPALRAASCVLALAGRLKLNVLGNEFGYCSANQPIPHPMLRWYRVLDVLPMDRKKVRAMSRSIRFATWELKSRNVDIDLIQLRKELLVDKDSDRAGGLLITKLGKQHICLVAEELRS
jgi:hypothetical protein